MVDTGNVGVVDVEQQAAAGAADHLADEGGLVHARAGKLDIGRRILQQQLALQAALHLIDMFADPGQGRGVVGQRQQVIEKHIAMARPGQVFGKGLRLIALEQSGQALEMFPVERLLPTYRQADAVDR
ncbi:hypothetical protein D9M68_890610 [compost metagenome]